MKGGKEATLTLSPASVCFGDVKGKSLGHFQLHPTPRLHMCMCVIIRNICLQADLLLGTYPKKEIIPARLFRIRDSPG